MMTLRRLVPVPLMLLALCAGSLPLAGAQTTAGGGAGQPAPEPEINSWSLSPGANTGVGQAGNRPSLTYEVAADTTLRDVVTLANYSNVALTFGIYATDAFNDADGGFAVLAGDEPPRDVGAWVELPQDNITVPAHTQVDLPITITVPADASPGDHAGGILASSRVEGSGPDGKTVTLDRRTGTRIYLRVSGQLSPELAVEHVSTTYSPAFNPLGGTAEVTYRIQNRGNVRLSGTQSVSIAGPFGLARHTSSTDPVPELLPGEGITVTRTFTGVLSSGALNTEVRLEPTPVAGDAGTLESSTRSAWSLALPVTIICGLVALALARYGRRWYLRHRRPALRPSGAGQ